MSNSVADEWKMSENSSREMSMVVAGVEWSHMNKIFPFKKSSLKDFNERIRERHKKMIASLMKEVKQPQKNF